MTRINVKIKASEETEINGRGPPHDVPRQLAWGGWARGRYFLEYSRKYSLFSS